MSVSRMWTMCLSMIPLKSLSVKYRSMPRIGVSCSWNLANAVHPIKCIESISYPCSTAVTMALWIRIQVRVRMQCNAVICVLFYFCSVFLGVWFGKVNFNVIYLTYVWIGTFEFHFESSIWEINKIRNEIWNPKWK